MRACEYCRVHVARYQAQDDELGSIDLCPHCYGEPHEDEPCEPMPPAPTLGEIAQQLDALRARGVTRESILYVIGRVWP